MYHKKLNLLPLTCAWQENRWKKRGLSLVPMWFGYNYHSVFRYSVHVVVYEHDGTVVVSHGGIEMGQGINTKVGL